jgi:conjugal transfer pilus assembly protein TraF
MRRRPWLLLSSLLVTPLWGGAADPASATPPPFFLDKARGWFWRETPPATPPARPTKPHAPPPIPAETPTPSPRQSPEPSPLTAAWFRQNLDRFRDRALDDPSPENVAAYYYLQRVMLDKAHRFTDVARQVVMADPNLDENRRRPIGTFAANEANRLEHFQAACPV